MRVNEIFFSLQGEGFHTGTPAVFIRLSGCNLRCPFCDTDFEAYREMTEDEICSEVRSVSGGMGAFVVITGGEPSLQLTDTLIDRLHEDGCYVAVETNGTHRLPDNVDWVTLSPKSDFVSEKAAVPVVSDVDEVKLVYTGQDVEAWRLRTHALHYFLQPCEQGGKMNTDATMAYILQHPWWRLSLQTHKMIGIR